MLCWTEPTDEPDQTRPDLVEEAVEVDPNRTLRRFWNKDHFKRFMQLIAIAATVVVGAQMKGYSERQEILWIIFLGAVYAVYAMESWAIPRAYDIQPKWKVIIFGITFTFAKLLSFYVLLYMLKPEWFSWCGFVIVFIIITAYKCSDELKTKFTWCCEKGILVINYVINKVLKPIRNDQASPASAPTRASA